ncbi:hypothetical protein GCM10027275_35320 [Rhabdobacter roseus]|uniref:Putative membrane protein YccC n=1 Tax=Rhabdobacter roseus TaxID=1655419 RepID=A0A840TLY8_9BACT|nr:FUSC family protein [Rhabdobacter roseus]MBB5285246.1 putative membrane protein YccC [Rhabdobacter roseus]
MNLQAYIRSEDTESALRFLVGASLPLLVSTWLGYAELGTFMLLGATFVFGIDVPLALPKKLGFMVLSGVLSALIFFVFTQVKASPVATGVLLFGILFGLNFLSPFSPNFTLVTLLLNLAVMIGLSMAATIPTLASALQKTGYLLLGSGWYILYALLLHPLQRPRQLRRRLQSCLRLTASYFAQQAALLEADTARPEVLLALSERQSAVTEAHQQIREVLLREPINLTNPDTFMGRATYFLAHLVDLFELATASAWSIQRLTDRPEKVEAVPLLRALNEYIVTQLHQLEAALGQQGTLPLAEASGAEGTLRELTEYLNELRVHTASEAETRSSEVYRTLRRVQKYTEQQLLTLTALHDILARRNVRMDLGREQLRQFALHETIEWSHLRSHFTFRSGFFRYALRMALTALAAYYLATWLHFSQPSWALLTVLVILKPGFNLSKERLAQRVYGTVLGVLAGLVLFYLFRPGPAVSMAIFLGSQFFAFSFIKRQYAVTSFFFTLFILFFYSYLHRAFMDTAVYRLLDTLLAAALCWLAMRFVFPYWEVQKLPTLVPSTLRANRDLLRNLLEQLDADPRDPARYKMYRKEAFLKMDELTSSYRLALAETPTQTERLSTLQRVTLLLYTQLSLIINLGLFLKRYPHYRWSDDRLRGYLQEALAGLNALIESDGSAAAPANDTQALVEELTRRRQEVSALVLQNGDQYLARVQDLFWAEGAYEIMEITHKLRQMPPTV